jgi:hypothetical protein
MANIRKTFNFRNGVQVDEDNLIVNSLGLVGIGTSVPTEILDVRGTAKIVGLATVTELGAINATIGVATITTLRAGGNISINSGVITATSGVVTFYGDGAGLINIPTSQWVDIDSGLGYTSIYAAGFVGVNTNFPYYPFQVGGTGNLSTFNNGVGIGSEGNILATGIVTAGSFSGNGASLTNLNANNIASGTISTNRLPVIPNDRLPSSISVSGIITAGSGFVGNLTGNLTGTANIALDLVSSARPSIDHITSNTSTVGIATVSTRLYAETIGIQTNTPQSDFHIFKTADASLQVTGQTESLILLGRSLGKTTNTAGLKFGNTSGLYPYSSGSTLDVINYDTGNLNYYLHYGNPTGINTGAFRWIYGKDATNPLMSLTYSGNLGIGKTNPSKALDVVGSGEFTGSVNIGSNLTVSGSFSASTISVSSLVADVTGNLTGNVNSSGVSTFFNIVGVNSITANEVFSAGATITNISSTVLDSDAVISSSVGIGTTFAGLRSAVDFADAGKDILGGVGAFMIVPRLSTAQRGLLTPQDGAIIYNTSTNEFQGYVTSSWVDLGASSGIGAVVDDTSPDLGGNLNLNSKNITGTGNISVTGSITANQVNISGLSTFAGITTVTGPTLFTKQLNVSGVTTSVGGFTSGIGVTNPVQIAVSGNVLTFTVAGVGSTSLILY